MPIDIWWDIKASERLKMTVASTNAEQGLIGARPIGAKTIGAKTNSPWRLSVESGTILGRQNDAAATIAAPARSGRHRLVGRVCSTRRAATDYGRQAEKALFSSRRSQPSKRTLTAHDDARQSTDTPVTPGTR